MGVCVCFLMPASHRARPALTARSTMPWFEMGRPRCPCHVVIYLSVCLFRDVSGVALPAAVCCARAHHRCDEGICSQGRSLRLACIPVCVDVLHLLLWDYVMQQCSLHPQQLRSRVREKGYAVPAPHQIFNFQIFTGPAAVHLLRNSSKK